MAAQRQWLVTPIGDKKRLFPAESAVSSSGCAGQGRVKRAAQEALATAVSLDGGSTHAEQTRALDTHGGRFARLPSHQKTRVVPLPPPPPSIPPSPPSPTPPSPPSTPATRPPPARREPCARCSSRMSHHLPPSPLPPHPPKAVDTCLSPRVSNQSEAGACSHALVGLVACTGDSSLVL